jgi:hypothetical protein
MYVQPILTSKRCTHRVHRCVYTCPNKQLLFPCTALTDWFFGIFYEVNKGKQSTYNVKSRRVRVTIVAVEKK